MILKIDGTVDAVTSQEELERSLRMLPGIEVRDALGNVVPGIQELNTDTMDAVVHIRSGTVPVTVLVNDKHQKLSARVYLTGCSIWYTDYDIGGGLPKTIQVNSKLLPIEKNNA